MFKLNPSIYMKLIKMGWLAMHRYGNEYMIVNPDDETETYTFKSNNQILWFIRGFESGLKKTEQTESEELTEESADEAQQQLQLEEVND